MSGSMELDEAISEAELIPFVHFRGWNVGEGAAGSRVADTYAGWINDKDDRERQVFKR